jgi:hypothetical protein
MDIVHQQTDKVYVIDLTAAVEGLLIKNIVELVVLDGTSQQSWLTMFPFGGVLYPALRAYKGP